MRVGLMAESSPPDKLSLVVATATFEKVHYALVMAAGAAAIGTPATLFFTMGACVTLTKSPGWNSLLSEKADQTSSSRDAIFADTGVATLEELLESCVELGVTFMVCEMGLRAENLEEALLREDLNIQRAGVVTFLNDASKNGAIIYI
jgi:peroxiredoxin family protein